MTPGSTSQTRSTTSSGFANVAGSSSASTAFIRSAAHGSTPPGSARLGFVQHDAAWLADQITTRAASLTGE
ncbi:MULTISPECIES: hypothetical protein [Kribbella]|uniref:hypothetical protein n=1 Tax=Kribbella TaxID=182639 RepID=UPI0010516E4C|nr:MULTISPECIES: hypothetical protein [Kribbella]